MNNYLKEKKKILRTITKFGTEDVVNPEVQFYLCSSSKYRTPELASHSVNHLTIEFIDGISCFNYLKYLNDGKTKEKYLEFLIGEILIFQEEVKRLNLKFKPYAIEEKLDENIQIMKATSHPLLGDALRTRDAVIEYFYTVATVPFRDATPKNSAIKLDGDNIDSLSVTELGSRTYHYDFSTVNQLTSRYDDIVSTLYHHFVNDELRDALLKKYGVETSNLEFAVISYLRIGRFWSRRYYYKQHEPKLFQTRYDGEDLSYYDRIYNESITRVSKMLG